VLGKFIGSRETSVTADHDDSVYAMQRDVLEHMGNGIRIMYGIETGGPENRPAARENTGDGLGRHGDNVAVMEAFPAITNADALKTESLAGCSHYSSDSRVQAGAVAPTGK
jgi:hypothetical protein